jgi:ribose transport system permease protein
MKGFSASLERFSGVYLWVLFIAVFGLWSPHVFFTIATAHLVASEQAVAGIIGLAVLIAMVCGEFDLSVGATANLAGITCVVAQVNWHWAAGPSIILAIVVGLAVGVANGIIVVRLGVSSFIATLGMGSIVDAFLTIVSKSQQPPAVFSSFFNGLTQHTVLGFQIIIIYLLVIAFIAWWVLAHTPVGRHMYATGGNREAARLSGIRVSRWSFLSLAGSGCLSAIGGVLYVSLTGPSLDFGTSLLLPAFAAVFLGSTQLLPGRFNVWGTLLAIYVLATGAEGLELVSGAQWISDMFNGVAVIAAVALAVSRQRRSAAGSRWRLRRRPPDGSEETQIDDLPESREPEPGLAEPSASM